MALVASVYAQTPVPACSQPAKNLDDALRQELACTRNAAFMHHLGRMLNQSGQYLDALDRLEAAILLDPQRWDAHLDYALALQATGDLRSAESLLIDLAANPEAAPQVREESRRLLSRQGSVARTPRRVVAGVSAGYDDNLLGVTRYSMMDLTLPGGPVAVEIIGSRHPIAGRFVRFDIDYENELHAGESANWNYALQASHRTSVDFRPADLTQFGFRIERFPTQAIGAYSIGVYQQLNRQSNVSLRQWQLGAGVEWNGHFAGLACRARVGGEYQNLAFPQDDIYDGNYVGLQTHWICPEINMELKLRAGEDHPTDSQRPGGDQRQYGVHIARHFAFGKGRLMAEFDYFKQIDREGYSPLLENNAPRSFSRSLYRLEYRQEFAGLVPYIGLEWLDQSSNLPLFAPRNGIITLGIRQSW